MGIRCRFGKVKPRVIRNFDVEFWTVTGDVHLNGLTVQLWNFAFSTWIYR